MYAKFAHLMLMKLTPDELFLKLPKFGKIKFWTAKIVEFDLTDGNVPQVRPDKTL